jgi:hypothetical protein
MMDKPPLALIIQLHLLIMMMMTKLVVVKAKLVTIVPITEIQTVLIIAKAEEVGLTVVQIGMHVQ